MVTPPLHAIRCVLVSTVAWLFFQSGSWAADIAAVVSSVTQPVGTPAEPHYVIDSDGTNAAAGYTRDSIPASARVNFGRAAGILSASETFRVQVQLLDPTGTAVVLSNADSAGGTTISSAAFTITLDKFTPSDSRTENFTPRPATYLGAGKSYTLRYIVQVSSGTFPFFTWKTATSSTSASFTVVHFNDTPENAANRMLRIYPTGAPTWTKTHLLITGTTDTARGFQVQVPYFYARYDLGGSAVLTTCRLTATVTDDTGADVPLLNSGRTTTLLYPNAYNAGAPNTPATFTANFTGTFIPENQLDSRNRTYFVKVRIEHIESNSPTTYLDGGESPLTATPQRLLHFNGNLRFGVPNLGLSTVFSAISNTPLAGTLGTNLVNTTIDVTAGTIPGFPDYTYGDGNVLSVQLYHTGDAVVTAGSRDIIVNGGGDVSATYGGVKVSYPSTYLSNNGVVASSRVVHLPQGLSYTPDRATARRRYAPTIAIPVSVALTNQFRQTITISTALPADAWVFDESRALEYQVSHFDFLTTGKCQFTAATAEWIHKTAYTTLEDQQADGKHEHADMAVRFSNEGYLRDAKVSAGDNVNFARSADGTMRTESANLAVLSGSFTTHFPLNCRVTWHSPGAIELRDGGVSDASALPDVEPLGVAYDGSCSDDACGPAGGASTTLEMKPTSDALFFSADGGLRASGQLPMPKMLNWGIRGDAAHTATHQTDEFMACDFLASGNQLYASKNPLVTAAGPLSPHAAVLAPSVLMLAGFDPSDTKSPIYAETARYADGVGTYPGLTFSVAQNGDIGGSRLADLADPYRYELQPLVSKYYVRTSGLSGRHVASEGNFSPSVNLYGYDFGVTRFQLTFLSNINKDSWFNGSVKVQAPCDFTQAFQEMKLTCTGGLDEPIIDPDDTDDKPLKYWGGQFTPLSMRFAPREGAGCYSPRFLTMGVTSGAANIATPLSGTLAFMPTGRIGTLRDAIVGADCRLGLPATVPMAGPGSETYSLTPTTKLYFNDPPAVNAPPKGFVSFAASCPVPYFQDIKAHITTSAQAGVPADLFITGGWSTAGETFFTNSRFDDTHVGYPASATTLSNYRSPTAETIYSPRAKQSLFGMVDLDYALEWKPTGRYFKSWPVDPKNLLVISIKHQVDYLSARNAEISFGAQYDGLPQINLVSTAIDLADGQLGVGHALSQAAGSAVTDTLNEGVDEIGKLINDSMEELLDVAINEIDGQVLDPLFDQVTASYADAASSGLTYNQWVDANTGTLKTEFDNYLNGSVEPARGSVKSRLKQLSAATTSASSIVARITSALDRGILAIDSVAGQIQTYEQEGNPSVTVVALERPAGFNTAQALNGILREVSSGGGEPERQIVQNLVGHLIQELAPPSIASSVGPLLQDASSEANAELNQLLTEFDPTLDRVTTVLLEIREYLVLARTKFQENGTLLAGVQSIIDAADADITRINNEIRSSGYNLIDRIASSARYNGDVVLGTRGNLTAEFSREEFRSLLRAQLRDQLLAAPFMQQIQYLLRQQISEIDLSLHSAIDSAFAEVGRMCKELLREFLGPIDDAINGLIGNIGGSIGAGAIDGYAHIQGDTLRRLRLDAKLQLKVPDEMNINGFLEMNCYDSETTTGTAGCLEAGQQVVEVKAGALDIPLDWVSPDMRADVTLWFSMQTSPSVEPLGVGGGITMTGGELNFQSLKITRFGAAVAVGEHECYFAGVATVIVSSYEASGGLFFGRTCSLDPLNLVDPDAASVLGNPPFTGAYVYGEVWIPISEALLGIPASCLFRISAGVGAGAFFFVEGPTFGGKMLLGLSGEALCVVSIHGDVSMIGVMSGGSLRFSGRGTLKGKAGYCPFCVKFKESARITYQDGSWDIDY